ncbi:MAG: sigma-70 family RNA polymerase sigma factor [Clostridia bacterium]|nr:sigma-70 family RNA polymerase sigma factor [Clostridia bacterium]
MEDAKIVELYWQREEQAIEETATKYGGYCRGIAYNVLGDSGEAEESVNDTWLDAWNSMPPHRPSILSTFLGKITRRVSIDRWRRKQAEKRGGGQMPAVLDELEDCVAAEGGVEQAVEQNLLAQTVNRFVLALPEMEQRVFLCRYWYMEGVGVIAHRFGFTESKVKSMLYRTREKLRAQLMKEGLL